MELDLAKVFQAAFAFVAALAAAFLIPWLREKTTNEQRLRVRLTVEALVKAAEQMLGEGMGAEKLDWVREQLGALGLKVSRELIEAAVYELNNDYSILYQLPPGALEGGTRDES